MIRSSKVFVVIVSSWSVVAASVSMPGVASAAACPSGQKESIFVRNATDRQYTNGNWGKLLWRDRFMDQDCDSIAVSTIYISQNDSGYSGFGDWIEIGWRHDRGVGWFVFTEKGVNFTRTQHYELSVSSPPFGTMDQYSINNTAVKANGTTDWYLQSNYGGSWGTYAVYNTNWHNGVGFGETEAIGNDTGMFDQHRVLQFLNNNLAWNPWGGANCRVDTSPDNGWHRNAADSYDVDTSYSGSGC